MSQLVKTTIMLPEELLQMAKYTAVREKTTVSGLIKTSLEQRLNGRIKKKQVKDPMSSLGKLRLGINKIYNKRSDLYEEHIRRKMGF